MTKFMALITAAGSNAWSLPLHPSMAAPIGFALGTELSLGEAALSALGLNAPSDSAWGQYLMDPWGYGEISMIAPQLAATLGVLLLSSVGVLMAPARRAPVVASGVALQPCSVLPSVTRVMLPPPDSNLPSLVTSRVYSGVLHGAPLDAMFEPPQAHFGAQLLPERSGHLKHGSMYWARLASDQVRTQLRSSEEVRNVVAFPCPTVPNDVTLCPPGCVPGNAEAWATAHSVGVTAQSVGVTAQSVGAVAHSVGAVTHSVGAVAHSVGTVAHSVGAAKLHLALNTPTVRTGAALTIALEEEVCSYLDGLEPYDVVRYAAAPDSTAVRVVLRSEFNRAALQAHTPFISIKDQTAVALRTVELEPLFADSLVSGGALGLGSAELAVVDSTVASMVPPSNSNYIFARSSLYELLLYLTEPSHDALFLSGPTGCGKTSAVFEVAARLDWPLESVTLSQKSEVSDLIGAHILDHGQLRFSYGPLARAMLYGEILLLNEIDLMSPGELAALNDVLEGRALTISANNGEVIKPHPFFRVVATANSKGQGDESGSYHGVKLQNQAFLDRWRFCEVGYPSAAQERLMLERACPKLNPDFRDGILRFATEVRLGHNSGLDNRALLQRLEQAEVRLLAATMQDLKEHAQALKDLLAQNANLPEASVAAAQAELNSAQLSPFFDELLAHQSLLTQYDGARDTVEANTAANELFAHCEEQMPGFEQLHENSCTQLERAQAVAKVEAETALSEGAPVSGLSAPFSSRSLLRIATLYYGHPELSVQEAISLGFASRLPPAEYEYLLRLSYDIFGYGSNFNALPHQVDDEAKYQQEKERLLKYNLTQVQSHLARLQKCQADLLAAKPKVKAKGRRKASA